ncbi:MAG: rhodanese-like domain-containing protein, partial [Pontibacter sp.]|nr:rhodanese-like domain-containing protein [Pontibacter sp.]
MLKGLYKGSVPYIKPEKVHHLLQREGAKVLLLDTRQAEEYAVSHIAGAKFVDYDAFKVNQLKDISKNTPIVLYCSVGYRSERIGEQLKAAGYTPQKHLYGGKIERQNQANP